MALDDDLEHPSRCVGGRRYLVWKDTRGRLHARADPTNRDSVEYDISNEMRAVYGELQEAHRAATRHHALQVDTPWSGAEPWTLHAPEPSTWRLYGVRLAFFKHHPRLRAEDLRSLQCLAAHRLPDAAGRPHLVLFVEARVHTVEEALLSQSPRVHALLLLRG
ncbi:hypothetical protein [Melittangium boletus]|uniref:hypothetical protein n=1 Tax=Melittangium boletus TaxID=83453 RepID=UPI003DA20E05